MAKFGTESEEVKNMALDESDRIAHVLRRAGFAACPEEIEQGVEQGLEATVNNLLSFESLPDNLAPGPDGLNINGESGAPPRYFEDMTTWWLNAMITTTRPVQEKMVLFWHGLFATSVSGVDDVRQMYLQNENFRGNFNPDTGQVVRPTPASPFPVGNFRLILESLTKDPAMLVWLDNQLNHRLTNEVGSNENYARELHELFSMGVVDVVTGEPNYTERDVRQASRALTGWGLRRHGDNFPRRFMFDSDNHDYGPYNHLGRRGGNNAGFIFDNIVQYRHPGQQQSSVGRFLGYRLFKFFGYDDPEPEIINALADVFDGKNRGQPYMIGNMLRTMFMPGSVVSEAFYSQRALKAHVKSPAEFLVSAFRLLKPDGIAGGKAMWKSAIDALKQMGQELFRPPDVSGWREGLKWINTTSCLARFNFANDFATIEPDDGGVDLVAIMSKNNLSSIRKKKIVDFFTQLLLQSPISSQTQQTLIDYLKAFSGSSGDNSFVTVKIRGLVHLIMTMPEFQLS
jgi:uncharacterized protein (DUF1800 family)